MDPFGAGAALQQPTPPGHISSAHYTGKDGARVRINVGGHQEKEKNENASKRDAGEKRREATNFKEAACCGSTAALQGAARQKWFV